MRGNVCSFELNGCIVEKNCIGKTRLSSSNLSLYNLSNLWSVSMCWEQNVHPVAEIQHWTALGKNYMNIFKRCSN